MNSCGIIFLVDLTKFRDIHFVIGFEGKHSHSKPWKTE
jgi:hypothetical protein